MTTSDNERILDFQEGENVFHNSCSVWCSIQKRGISLLHFSGLHWKELIILQISH